MNIYFRITLGFFGALILNSLFAIPSVSAAVLYLDSSQSEYYQNETFGLKIRIDTEGECINAVEASLIFPKDILKIVDISKGGSIVTFWIQEPGVLPEENIVSFAGGLPGGYCGKISGDPGESDLLLRIFFQVNPSYFVEEKTSIEFAFLKSAKVLLNDGFATPAPVKVPGAKISLLPEFSSRPEIEWQEELEKDNIPPEPFSVKINRNALIFEGKWSAFFHTIDSQTGIDYYEIKEGEGEWEKAQSPYQLKDQSLSSIIKVRAVDKAGNEQIAQYLPKKKKSLLSLWFILAATLIIITWLIITKRSQYNENKKQEF